MELTISKMVVFLAGKTCCAFDCYTCGRLGGVRQKRKAKATLRNYMQRKRDLHNNLDMSSY